MQKQEIRLGQAVYELQRVFGGTADAAALIREKLEAAAGAIDADERKAV